MFPVKCCFCVDQRTGVRLLGTVLVFISAIALVIGVIIINQGAHGILGEDLLPFGKVIVVVAFISVFVNSFLLLDRKLKCSLLVWMMMSPPAIVLFVVMGIYLFMAEDIEALNLEDFTCRIIGGCSFVVAALLCYFWLVVYSLNRRLNNSEAVDGNDPTTIFVVQVSATDRSFNKGPPPSYSAAALYPPPPKFTDVQEC